MNQFETQIASWLAEDSWRMNVLEIASSLDLPDWRIGAGFLRNLIWDKLHKYSSTTDLNDVDIVYFDRSNIDSENDIRFENRLGAEHKNIKWSVKNQARMHEYSNNNPFKDTDDAISHWPEIPTCMGVRLEESDKLNLFSAFDWKETFDLIVRPNPILKDISIFTNRVSNKGWSIRWPQLKIVYELNAQAGKPTPTNEGE